MTSNNLVYLDNAATTPVEPLVAEAMSAALLPGGPFGNPSSNHEFGRDALAIVETAREQLARLFGAAPRELIWTSGATESDNMAITGAARFRAHRGKHAITMPVEHKAVTDTFDALEREGFEVTRLSPKTLPFTATFVLSSLLPRRMIFLIPLASPVRSLYRWAFLRNVHADAEGGTRISITCSWSAYTQSA